MRTTEFTIAGKTKKVLEFGVDQPRRVVLLHELDGITDGLRDFAQVLAGRGYRVAIPVLFDHGILRNGVRLCVTSEFATLAAGRSSAIADWIRDFCAAQNQKVAVIGMCATGGLVMSLLFEPAFNAGVMAQPSLPFRPHASLVTRCELGASGRDVELSIASGKPVLAMAFADDWICPRARLDRLASRWADTDGAGELRTVVFPGDHHSTLVAHADRAMVDGSTSREILYEFLDSADWS